MQPAFSEIFSSRKANVKFKKINGFEFLRNLVNVILIFDNSREDIYTNKKLARLATAVTKRVIFVKYFRQNLFQQSRSSRTIDLNINLFKSSRDVQHLDHL